ncbi:MAG TPA: hypothetical protein VFT04_14215 [Gemmatimonadales bacterium]|nr:hypothetical protein [Gemmatimonadales bacterium]
MSKGSVAGLVAAAGFAGFLLYGTLESQSAECFVVVDFRGRIDSATASAASEEEAARQAQTTACGTIAFGMDESIACGNVRPVRRVCQAK